MLQLLPRDDERRADLDEVLAAERCKAALLELREDPRHDRTGHAVFLHGFAGFLVLYDLECAEQTDAARLADALVLLYHLIHERCNDGVHLGNVALDVVILVVIHRCNACCTRQRVAAVRQAALQYVLLEILRHALADDAAAQLNITAGNALCERDDVRLDVEIHKREHLSGAVEARHDFIADEQDAILVAQGTHAFHIAVRRQDHAVRADDGLHHDGSNIVGALIAQLEIERIQILLGDLGIIHALGVAVAVHLRVHKVNEAVRTADLSGISSPVARSIGSAQRCAVVAAVAGKDLGAAGDHARHLDGVLVGFCAAVGEEHALVGVRAGSLYQHLGEYALGLGSIRRRHKAHLVSLCLDGLDDLRQLVAQIGADQQRGHVGVLVAVVVVEVDALGTFYRQHIAARLGPRLHDIILMHLCDFFSGVAHPKFLLVFSGSGAALTPCFLR